MKPVNARDEYRNNNANESRDDPDPGFRDATLSRVLMRVLKKRYAAVQQTDDENSDLSSIESDCDYSATELEQQQIIIKRLLLSTCKAQDNPSSIVRL